MKLGVPQSPERSYGASERPYQAHSAVAYVSGSEHARLCVSHVKQTDITCTLPCKPTTRRKELWEIQRDQQLQGPSPECCVEEERTFGGKAPETYMGSGSVDPVPMTSPCEPQHVHAHIPNPNINKHDVNNNHTKPGDRRPACIQSHALAKKTAWDNLFTVLELAL